MGPNKLGKGKGPGKKTDKTSKTTGPTVPPGAKYPIELHKTPYRSGYVDKYTVPMKVQDRRDRYIDKGSPFTQNSVNFQRLNKNKNTDKFLKRYDNEWSRKQMKKQTGMSDYDIDNLIIRGTEVKEEFGNVRNKEAGAEYSYYDPGTHKEENVIRTTHEHKHDSSKNMHERVHASGFDSLQGNNLMDILGNSFQNNQRNAGTRANRYLNKPYEAYGNFVEFRENIKLKPGEQIDAKELKRRVEKEGLEYDMFYRAFDDEGIIKALNTIASNGEGPANPRRIRNTYDV